MINRYTVGAGLGLLALVLLWLTFGGAIVAWTAGVGRAIKGNNVAIEQLHQANEEALSALAEKSAADRQAEEIKKKFVQAQRQIEAKQREVDRLAALNADLATKSTALDTQISALPKIQSLEEAHRAFQALGPPYTKPAP